MSYRPDLPTPIPFRLRARPIVRGYPLPWFVADNPDGPPDFRVADFGKFKPAIERRLCWICGQPLLAKLAFTIGAMCAINRTISEPPSHPDCAEWAARACPFLNQREKRRRTNDLPDDAELPPGISIDRQPGVTCLWICRSYRVMRVDAGILFKIGSPIETRWFCEGRPATRAEVLTSIESGYLILLEAAQAENVVHELEAARDRAMTLLPEEIT